MAATRAMSAMPTAPTSQPARVYGTHGAGAFSPVSASSTGVVSAPGLGTPVALLLSPASGSVQ